MGCTQTRSPSTNNIISADIKYILPEITKSIKLAQQCIYAQDSPIQLTPVKLINHIYCKIERCLPSGSVKIRGAYHLLYRLLEKKRHQGAAQLNVVVSQEGNFSIACLESLKLFENRKYEQLPSCQISQNDVLHCQTPTDPGMSVEIQDHQIQSRFVPYEPLGEIVIFTSKKVQNTYMQDYQKVRIIETNKNQQETEMQAFKFAEDNDYEYLDQYNDIDAIGGYATVGLEIEQWIKLSKTNIQYVFVTYNGGSVLAGIALYLKYIVEANIKIVGVILEGVKRQESSLSASINSGLIDEIVLVNKEDVERAQCELAQAEEITEFNAAIAYAGCRKLNSQNSLVVLSGGNVAISELQKLKIKYLND